MFRRLVFENSAAVFTLVAFITAVSIYVMITWRALRMKRSQVAQFANLPFEIETPAAGEAPAGRVGEEQMNADADHSEPARSNLPSR